ncbi:MAG: RagB/SusD family nutrient uptake outer membrane protein [Candidatus Cyclobacteriaceae bacterium M3_2C_046]
MKTFNRIKYIPIILMMLVSWSCSEEFLDRPPEDALTIDNFYQTNEQIAAATAALYGFPWFEFNDKAFWAIGDAMAGNHYTNDGQLGEFFVFGLTQNNAHLNEAWNSLFRVVAHSNSVINNVPAKAGEEVSDATIHEAVAEAKFMRAVAYFYMVRLWGPVPIIENNSAIIFDSKVPRNEVEYVYQFIINDLTYAMENLPTENETGRVTRWSAEGMLAKVYLQKAGIGENSGLNQADLDMAKQYAADVIKNSGLSLMPVYADLFEVENEDNEEALFAFQWIACQDWGTQNTNQAYFAYSNQLTGTGDGWGGYVGPSIDLTLAFEQGDQRRKATIMQDGDYYPRILQAEGGYTYVQQPSDELAENAAHAAVKKYVIGTPNDNDGNVCFMSTGLDTYVLRLADVYLTYAEAILADQASTSDPEALTYFNAVRKRAGLEEVSEITYEDIIHERRVEFAYEAKLWYDLVRWHQFDPQAAISYINNQERGTYSWDDNNERELNTFKVNVTDEDFVLPIPASELDQNPRLVEAPVPYVFD